MKKRILTQALLLFLVAAMCMLSACKGEPGEKGDVGATGNGIAEILTEKIDGGTKVTIKYTDTSKADVVFTIPDGAQGIQGEKGEKGDPGEQGFQGEQGEQGEQGIQGDKGEDGRGILKAEIIDGYLWITYTDEPQYPVNVGRVSYDTTTPEGTDPEQDPPIITPPTDEPDDGITEKIDMGGYTYKAYVRYFAGTDPDPFQAQTQNGNNDYYCIDFWVDEQNSENDMLSYATYQRNQKIQKDYNCKIQQIDSVGSQLEHLLACYANGDGYDLTIITAKPAAQAATYNLLRDLNSTTYLDLSHPSYDQNSINEFTVSNKLYFLSGDMNISTIEVLPVSLVNMLLYRELSDSIVEEFAGDITYANIYNIVTSQKWTMETMMKIAQLANIDVDVTDGPLNAVTDLDAIGYYQYLYSPVWYFYGSSGRITTKNDVGTPKFSLESSNGQAIYNHLFDKFNRNHNTQWLPQGGSDTVNSNFLTGNVLFTDSTLFNVRTEIYWEAEFEYGLLPIPVLEEGMDYQSVVYFNNWAHLWAIPQRVNNQEYAERLMQIMATYSTETTMDAYYRTVYLSVASNNGSRQTIDTILNSMVYDVALLYSWGGIDNWINQVSTGYNNDYAMIVEMLTYVQEDMNATIAQLINPQMPVNN